MPLEVNAFIGRENELARLRALHASARVLTLVGPGGVGKTRLAQRLEHEVRDAFPDGTWLVDLSPITEPALVLQAVGDALSVRQPQGLSWLEELTRVLRSRRLLLVLDNCEHVIGACADLIDCLVRACKHIQVLATSLQPLDVAGETTWRVRPLAVPPASAQKAADVKTSDAVRLFVDRVQAHVPDFTLNDQNARTVAEICRRLDGLPLALELVAARVESLGVAEVGNRLSDRFALAVGTSQRSPARQRTLQAALEWSCSLLTTDELTLLRRVTVFVGGWTLEAAETVCSGGTGSCEVPVVDTLGRLVTKSLVVADHGDVSVRYRLLETVRMYVLKQLAAGGETAALQRRHAEFMVQLAERAEPESYSTTHAALLKADEDNLRAALGWALQSNQAGPGLRLATAAFQLWWLSGHYAEGCAWFDGLLALPQATAASARGTALTFNAQLRLMLGDYAVAQALGQMALEHHQARSDARGIALTLMVLGNAAVRQGDLARAGGLHLDAARRLHELGNRGEMVSLFQCGVVASELGDTRRVLEVMAEIEAIGRARPEPLVKAGPLYLKARLAIDEGDIASAATSLEEALALHRSVADQQQIVVALIKLGHVRLDLGQPGAAFAAFSEALQSARASGERVRLIHAVEGIARWISATDADSAVRLAGAAGGQRQVLGVVPWPSERRTLDAWLDAARRALGQRAYQLAWKDGHTSTLTQAVSLAESLSVQPFAMSRGTLSPREQEVAGMLARGMTNKQIAAELIVSPATVRSHVEHILTKLDLRSRAQVAVWATQRGLLVVESTR